MHEANISRTEWKNRQQYNNSRSLHRYPWEAPFAYIYSKSHWGGRSAGRLTMCVWSEFPNSMGVWCMNSRRQERDNLEKESQRERKPERQCTCSRKFNFWRHLLELELSPCQRLIPKTRRKRKRIGFLWNKFHSPAISMSGWRVCLLTLSPLWIY